MPKALKHTVRDSGSAPLKTHIVESGAGSARNGSGKEVPFVTLVQEPLSRTTRVNLVLAVLIMTTILLVARYLEPRDSSGQPYLHGSHRQLGLPPCAFYSIAGQRCPGCGLTTSFCHFMHGDLENSLRANVVGTVMACAFVVLIPFCSLSALTGRRFGIASYSDWLCWLSLLLVFSLLLHWSVRLQVEETPSQSGSGALPDMIRQFGF